jgi:hypothetical protein
MSFQAYLDNIKAKTGKSPKDFLALAKKKGLLETSAKAGQIVDWLKRDFDLGHGHAMAIVATFKSANASRLEPGDKIAAHFSGDKSKWRKPYEALIKKLNDFGTDISVSSTESYLSLLRKGKKFGIVRVVSDRLDIGIKVKGAPHEGRFEDARKWNAMVTHRVKVSAPSQIDIDLLSWLRRAYDQV